MSADGSISNPLRDLEPVGMAADDDGWQKRKSAQTRIAVLEAAVECLASQGYSRTTTQLIAQTANISRGAMMHHYATKQELIDSVIDYTFFKRMEVFTSEVKRLSERERVEEQAGIEIFWQSLLTREYQAYLELAIAARTDAELRALFEPKAQRFDTIWREQILNIFPEWRNKPRRLLLAVDFCQAAMEGLLFNRSVWAPRERRVALRKLVSVTILALRSGLLEVDGVD
ncbi:MAG: TetR/AcrR family transcriptional regulator [Caulobacterales bacterium]